MGTTNLLFHLPLGLTLPLLDLSWRLAASAANAPLKWKTPPASEDVDGVFHAFTSFKVTALEQPTFERRVRSAHIAFF
jgi:hypothetical protein